MTNASVVAILVLLNDAEGSPVLLQTKDSTRGPRRDGDGDSDSADAGAGDRMRSAPHGKHADVASTHGAEFPVVIN